MSQWFLKAKNNSTQAVVAVNLERAMASFQCVKRFNALGNWQLTLEDTVTNPSPFASVFLQDASGNLHNGIIVQVDNQDGNGLQTVLSGPQIDIDVQVDQSGRRTLTATGHDEMHWLKYRRAFQVVHYPYILYVASSGAGAGGESGGVVEPGGYNLPTPAAYFPLLETSGTTAQNLSSANNGTYTGGVTLNQPSLLDDPNPCIKLDGSTGYVSVPTAGLPTGNNAWTVLGWGMISTSPSGTACLWSFGTNAAKQDIVLGITSSNFPTLGGNSLTSITGTTAVPLNEPFLLAATWDGTTLTLYHYSSKFSGVVGTSTPGALSITYGTVQIGAFLAGAATTWNGYAAQAGFWSSALTTAQIANVYAVGSSRQAWLAYDTETFQASQLLIYYVQRNAAASSVVTNAGVAAPATTFTNWQRTTTARAVPSLTLAADPAKGSTITGVARQDVLLELLGALALASNPELGFKLELSGSTIQFSVYQPSDKTTTAVFSLDRKNLLDYRWKYSAATGNHVIAGGANPAGGSSNLTERIFGENEDATSISQFGLLEDFLDYRQTSSGGTLQQMITAQLLKEKQPFVLNVTPLATPNLYFMGPGASGYQLGDKVTVIVDGQVFQELVREVQIDLQPNQPAVITAAIGTPVDAGILHEFDLIDKRIAKLKGQADTLDTNY